MKITKRIVDAVEAGSRDAFLWDSDVKGFGLKVTPNGTRTYLLQYRMGGRGSPTRRYTIGKHGSPWTPDAARQEAERLLRIVAAGRDPQSDKVAARRAPRAGDTVRDAFGLFHARHLTKLRSGAEVERMLERDVLPSWGPQALKSITKRDVIALLDDVVKRGSPIAANRIFAGVRKFLNWCVDRDLIEASPAAGVKPPSAETDRDRQLEDAELRLVWRAAETMGYPFGDAVRLLILTAQRRDEVGAMEWAEVDLDAGLWTIPKERAKNRKAHVVHLSPAAFELLRAVPRMAVPNPKGGEPLPSPYVFTTTGRTPVSGWSRAKAQLDALALQARRSEAAGQGRDADAVEPPAPWVLHDFRRTVTTSLSAMRVPPHVADKILNHARGTITGVAAVYNRFEYLDERKDALHAWGRRLEGIVGDLPAGNVVELRRG